MLTYFTLKLVISVLCITSCYADINWSGFGSCNPSRNNSTSEYKTNVNSILRVLEEKGPQRNGFYQTTVGKEPDKVYGLVQCTGDVSAQNCSQCIKDAAHEAFGAMCNTSKYVALWYRWRYLRLCRYQGIWGNGRCHNIHQSW
ncbi:hypothetical protein QQ045_029930 [Rhodiola kirilowii]